MIIESLCNIFIALIKSMFSWISLPSLPSLLNNVFDLFIYIIQSSLGIVFVFFDRNYLLVMMPIVIAIINLEHIYKFTMFILRKIPFLGIE